MVYHLSDFLLQFLVKLFWTHLSIRIEIQAIARLLKYLIEISHYDLHHWRPSYYAWTAEFHLYAQTIHIAVLVSDKQPFSSFQKSEF